MKAFLLAAGTGSRLRPITEHTPKCMLTIGGKPLLDLWLDALHRAEVDEVLVNLHHLPSVVVGHLRARSKPPAIRTAYEPELLGSAGTLRHHRAWVQDDEFFLAVNADNLTDFDMRCLIDFHRSGDAEATLTVFRTEHPSRCGLVEVDSSWSRDRICREATDAGEQSGERRYLCLQSECALRDRRNAPERHRLPASPAAGWTGTRLPVADYFCDIGTPAAYQQAIREWQPKVPS